MGYALVEFDGDVYEACTALVERTPAGRGVAVGVRVDPAFFPGLERHLVPARGEAPRPKAKQRKQQQRQKPTGGAAALEASRASNVTGKKR